MLSFNLSLTWCLFPQARAAVVTAAAVEDTTRLHSTATLTVHQCSTTKSQYTNKCHNNKPNQHHTITHLRTESHKLTHAQLLMALSAPVLSPHDHTIICSHITSSSVHLLPATRCCSFCERRV